MNLDGAFRTEVLQFVFRGKLLKTIKDTLKIEGQQQTRILMKLQQYY
jgi:hypothetical protein